MSENRPRIYTYKITFEEVPYYYYGFHKEKKFGEYYMGSPKTHKWAWDFYIPKIQILQIFEYNDEGFNQAQEVEKRLIKPFYKTDPLCLNESCGGNMSLKVRQKGGRKTGDIYGKINGNLTYKLKTGVHGRSKEKMVEDAIKAGQRAYELGVGAFGRTKEQWRKDSQKAGRIGGKKGGKAVSSQQWQCTVTNYVSTPAGLSIYQRSRGIETSNRIRIK